MNDKTEWVMVPREPTPEMLTNMRLQPICDDDRNIHIGDFERRVYGAAIAAAPTPPAQEDQLDAAAAEIARLRSESATQSERLDALKAENDGLFNLLRKCANSMDAGRIDVDLIEEVRELFHKDRA